MRLSLLLAPSPALLLFAACATAPAAKSPLRERLATADTPTVEDGIRGCLTSRGFKVDPVGSVSGGMYVVSARSKGGETVQVFIHAPEDKPRLTGGPDDDAFWSCLADKLAGAAPADEGDGGAASDKGDGGKS